MSIETDLTKDGISKEALGQMRLHYDRIPYGFCTMKMVYDKDGEPADGQIVYANAALSKIFSISQEDFLKYTLWELFPDINLSDIKNCGRVASSGEPWQSEAYSVSSKKYLRVLAFQYAQGYTACFVEDKTQEYFFKNAMHSFHMIQHEIYFVDLERDYFCMIYPEMNRECGKYYEQVLSYMEEAGGEPEDIKNIQAFLNPSNIREALTEQEYIAYRWKRVHGQKEEAETKAAAPEWCLISFTAGEKRNGIPVTAVMVIRGIDELVKREEEQKRQLAEATERGQAAAKAKSLFLSTMSHDMRTPLNAIIGMSRLASMHQDEPEKVRDYLDKIMTSGKHLMTLINEVLDTSKIENGRLELLHCPFSVLEMLREVVVITKNMIAAKKQILSFSMKGIAHERVVGDENRLMQVLLNIVSNAAKYTGEEGNIAISVEEKKGSTPDVGQYYFVITDDGMGMSDEYQTHMFEPFSREQDARVDPVSGTGLGTTIAKQIVEQMGGEIYVESRLGEGTKITVSLPLMILEEPQLSIEPEKKILPVQTTVMRKDALHALVVEDNSMNAEIAVEFLKYYGVEASVAYNGQSALDLFEASEQGSFDCIFMDLQMPVLNGIDAAKMIRGLRRGDAGLPIFAMTANVFTDDILETKRAGLQEHIGKPVSITRIGEVLHKWFPGRTS